MGPWSLRDRFFCLCRCGRILINFVQSLSFRYLGSELLEALRANEFNNSLLRRVRAVAAAAHCALYLAASATAGNAAAQHNN